MPDAHAFACAADAAHANVHSPASARCDDDDDDDECAAAAAAAAAVTAAAAAAAPGRQLAASIQLGDGGGGSHGGGGGGGGGGGASVSMGIVMAADGSSAQYADAVHVALHNIRTLHRSPLSVEVFPNPNP